MGIWDRLGNVIRSYLNDEDEGASGKNSGFSASKDPDLDAAFEELNDFLSGRGERRSGSTGGESGNSQYRGGRTASPPPLPESLRADFAELGLPFGASAEECKAAYKRLLKIHHPDRHAGHAGNMKKATEKSAGINAAYDRIDRWRRESPGR